MARKQSTIGLVSALLVAGGAARGAVTQPNGMVVPDLRHDDPTYSEQTLASYFVAVGEYATVAEANEQTVAVASAEPGQFSPLCSFEATLVLSVSGASAGIAWYNVPADPTAPPGEAELHHILPPSNAPDATLAATDITADPAYAGGYIGFALTKDFDGDPLTPPTAIYYSEYRRNALCTDCSPPGHWVAALAFRSNLRADTYYLAFEDWEGAGASASSWQNDGDFNDKVFKLVGISCAGGGLECQTGQLGLCARGLTECTFDDSPLACRPQYTPQEEECDAIDNDCDGETDEGELCPPDRICVRGSCVSSCSSGEFVCPAGFACGNDGYCIDTACVNVSCEDGLACRGGYCVNACSDVVCPLGQTCVAGECQDLCRGVVCQTGSVCQDGVCIGTCGCTPCAGDQICDVASGYCVDPGCEGVVCPEGNACVAGACVDVCSGARCPGGAACVAGACEPVVPEVPAEGTEGTGGVSIILVGGTSPTSPGTGGGPVGTSGGSGSLLRGADGDTAGGCGCRAVPSGPTRPALWLGAWVALLAVARRRARLAELDRR